MHHDAVGDAAAPLTVFFADISGSSLMYAVRGDAVAFDLTSTCLNVMEEQVQQQGGRVFKRVGDAVLAVFHDTERAVHAAAGIQRVLDAPECTLRREGMHVRVGISCGTAVVDAGDVFGDVVNVAARLVSRAGADEIFLSERAYERLPAALRASARLIDQVVLRGRPAWVPIYQYIWKHEDVTVRVGRRVRVPTRALEATYRSQAFVVTPERPKLKIGRGPDNDLRIEREFVSRYHAEITLRGDKFFLSDSSTNGTYLHTEGAEPLRVSREDVLLAGSGRILPGSESAEPIAYRVSVRD